MQIRPLQIGELEVKYPIIQGGMGIGISLGNLAGSVAKEGGVGIISAAQIGFQEADFDQNPLKANLRAIVTEYEKARMIAPEGVIGFNIMVAMQNYAEYVHAAIAAGADLIVSGAGLPTELPDIAANSVNPNVKLAPIVGTSKSASVILRYWDRKYGRVPDLLVIEGPSAGGHLGFTREQLEIFDPETWDLEVKRTIELVRTYEERYGKKIPIALAGGIWGAEEAEHAFSLGVDAVQVATRFVTTEECDADIRYKEAYLNAKKEDIRIVKSPVGMPGRAIANPMIEQVMNGERIPPVHCRGCLKGCNPGEIPYCITEALMYAAEGKTDMALLFCGSNAYRAERIETVKEVIDSILTNVVKCKYTNRKVKDA